LLFSLLPSVTSDAEEMVPTSGEEEIRYRTAAGANWASWCIWLDRCPHCGDWHLTSQPKRRR
jgi:hypothetical protein